jgi:pyruvate dehydrogenase E1 component
MKYLDSRGLAKTEGRKVWAFMGDGEMDEPESLGAISLASRENLDNLIFTVNCNLQRLDGPVRGNGKIIQELEGCFRGAGWNVIKVIWGSYWDPLLAKDTKGLLQKRMMECVDGEYQTFKSRDGSYVRKHFFGKYPELLEMVANMSDDDIWRLNRGGHDPHKVYAAYASAVNHTGQPTVILAKTIKGYGMGEAGEAQNITHQQKKMGTISLKSFRDRFHLPVPDNEIEDLPYLMFEEGSPELAYMKEKRNVLGGLLHKNQRQNTEALQIPALSAFDALLKASGEGRESSTTMVFVRILNILVKDKIIRKRIVPIVADESRTFGMEGMFRQLGIWSSKGQLYTPEDADKLMYYKEDKDGQILQEGINEAGAMSSWIAAATAYSTHGVQMIPFFIFYSMFGFQRIGDLAWAAADMRCRGFLMGGTAGRTTLNGEGLQHEDGHSHLLSSTIPNCISYDPTFSYELVVIIQDGMRRMYQEQEDVYYYITVMNENYSHPEMPKGSEEGILKGMYLFREGSEEREKNSNLRIQLLGSGTILREVIAAADILKEEYGIISDIWSVTSFNELRREALDATRWNMLHPAEKPKKSYVESCLEKREGPVVAATDYMKIFADQIREFVPGKYKVLGTDGFGRSDTREKLREFFEVDRYYVTVAALKSLEEDGKISSEKVVEAINKYNIDPDKPNPIKV